MRRVGRRQPLLEVFLDDLGEVVDRVQKDVRQFGDFRLDVPGYGDIDHEYGPVAPVSERSFDGALAHYRQGTARRGDDDVVILQRGAYVGELHGRRLKAGSQFLGVGDGAVGNCHGADALFSQMLGNALNGIAGSEQQCRLAGQIGKDLFRHGHRGIGDRHRVTSDIGVGPHPFCGIERNPRQQIQFRPQGAEIARQFTGRFDLAHDLRLAEYLGIEPGGNPDQVARRILVPVAVGSALDLIERDGAVFGEPPRQRGFPRRGRRRNRSRCGCRSTG